MPRVDPFAPATSPLHPRNAAPRQDRTAARLEQEARDAEEYAELEDLHVTDAERDTEHAPSLDDLRLRRDALVDYLEHREQDSDAMPPTVVDGTGAVHWLVVSEDGNAAHWETQKTDGAEEGDGYDDMKVAELEQLLKDRGLPHTGVKAELIGRLREHDQAAGTETGVDPLDSALSDLDAARGKR